MATAMRNMGVLAGMAMVATFALACSQGDNQCGGQEDCPAKNCLNGVCQSGQNDGGTVDGGRPQNDGGNADGGTPDGGCISLYTQQPVPCSGLNIQYVRRAVNGRYLYHSGMAGPGGSDEKVALLKAAACTEWTYPVTEFCLHNTNEMLSGVLPDMTTSGCTVPLDESGLCTDEINRHDKIWLCDCSRIAGQTNEIDWPNTPNFLEWCQSLNHPSHPNCEEGGVVVESFITYSQQGEVVDIYRKFLAKND